MTILLLKGYNNYFNRIIKKESSILAYKNASSAFLEYTSVNFDPADGIATTLVVGGPNQKITETIQGQTVQRLLDFEDAGSPDYLIVHEDNVIKYRWFIIECVRLRSGQYKLALKRDVLVDFNIEVMNSPCFVEKGYINDVNDPLLLNAEGMSFNQIKKDETYIQDDSHCAWLVGYVHKNLDNTQLSGVNPVTYTKPNPSGDIPDATSFAWEPCISYNNLDGTSINAAKNCLKWNKSQSVVEFRTLFQNESWPTYADASLRVAIGLDYSLQTNSVDMWDVDWGKLNSNALLFKDGNQFHWIDAKAAKDLGKDIADHTANWAYVKQMFDTLVSNATTAVTSGDNVITIDEDITKYNNTYVTKDNKVYLLTIGQGTPKTYDKFYTGNDGVANDYLSSLYFGKTVYGVEYFLTRNTDNPSRNKIRVAFNGQQYTITATEVIIGETVTYNFPISAYRNTCDDALYDMFCMPISPAVFGLEVPNTDVVITVDADNDKYIFLDQVSEYQLALATELATKMGAGGEGSLIYDLQLLPYCPVEGLKATFSRSYGPTYGKYAIDLADFVSTDYTVIKNGDSVDRCIVFYPKKANFSKTVELNVPNETVHYGWQEIKNPTLLAQGTKDGLPLYSIGFRDDFPYKVDYNSVWDVGPNANNPTDDLIIEGDLSKEDCEYLIAYISGGLDKPVVYMTSTDFPTPPAGQEYTYTFTGDFTIKVRANWILPDNSLDKKIKNECDFYRIVSPNFNGLFEFKNTKLANGLQSVNIDCTYKPFTPYIKLNPNLFDSLYSSLDFNDSIGLICGGDFSISMLSDAMINYELQNRNYQAIFNRNLQNLDVNQQIAKEQQQFVGIVGAITGSVGGAGTGALAGAKVGGGYGAIAGAVLGGAGGTAAGIIGYEKDREWLERQQAEARDFAVDKFNYQLGNIQALPQSITKSSPLSFNNKVWPILEHFSCTDREKELLENKIKYDGMTIMAIGQLTDYSVDGGYLKGKMIRLTDLIDDSHIAQAIYEEVDKGFYEGE